MIALALLVSCAVGWYAVDWWTLRRPLHAPTERGRELRYARIDDGRPLSRRCTDCGRRLRGSVWHPSWGSALDRDVGLCDRCIEAYPDRNDFAQWMGFDLVRR